MRKIFLSAVAVVSLCSAAQAQVVRYGIKAGVNLANFAGSIEDSNARTGFHAGVVTELLITDDFSVGAELFYSQQGSKTEESLTELGSTTKSEYKQTLNYVNLPIVGKYMVFRGFTVHAGPQIGFLLSAKGKTDIAVSGDSVGSGSASDNNKDRFESVDFSAVAGMGYELPTGLFIEARYQAGLSGIYKDSEEFDFYNYTTMNRVISFSIGYKF